MSSRLPAQLHRASAARTTRHLPPRRRTPLHRPPGTCPPARLDLLRRHPPLLPRLPPTLPHRPATQMVPHQSQLRAQALHLALPVEAAASLASTWPWISPAEGLCCAQCPREHHCLRHPPHLGHRPSVCAGACACDRLQLDWGHFCVGDQTLHVFYLCVDDDHPRSPLLHERSVGWIEPAAPCAFPKACVVHSTNLHPWPSAQWLGEKAPWTLVLHRVHQLVVSPEASPYHLASCGEDWDSA
mmetsp:Transcript_25740/g.60080  ORF Transcript_25740/g.60080 Transcript_25740/m.60080 type:complete len:242 (-) Transcript_25740:106-831(-)